MRDDRCTAQTLAEALDIIDRRSVCATWLGRCTRSLTLTPRRAIAEVVLGVALVSVFRPGVRVHVVGVGGAGMSGMAMLLAEYGAVVSGSDASDVDDL